MRRCAAPVIVYCKSTRASFRAYFTGKPARAAQLPRDDSMIFSTIIQNIAGVSTMGEPHYFGFILLAPD
jgi:hypothetical protein